jgi:glycosyltransferase involved in cell wall biosynthesis
MATTLPKVSIGMPVYNGAAYLKPAIDALLTQSFTDFELIIGDNASTDGTQRICEQAAMADRRVRYSRHACNIGPKDNFLYVLDQAQGHYFMWAAHDDLREPQFVERLVAVLEAAPQAVLASARFDLIDENDRRVRVVQHDWGSHFGGSRFRQIARMISLDEEESAKAVHIYGLMRREVVSRSAHAMSSVDTYSGYDICVLIDMLFQGEFVFVDELLMHYRISCHPSAPAETAHQVGNALGIASAIVRKGWEAARQYRRYHHDHFRAPAEYFRGMRLSIRRNRRTGLAVRGLLIGLTYTRQVRRVITVIRTISIRFLLRIRGAPFVASSHIGDNR